jgi:bifunctional DNase/RNase
MEKIKLEIVALSHSITQNHSYAIVLGETKGNKRLPVVIGGAEAQAIAIAMEKMKPTRPLTHDLMKSVFDEFDIILREVVISNILEGVFYSQLICIKEGKETIIDSRTSDAIALAIRFDCPIYTYKFILDTAGIVLDESGQELVDEPERKASLSSSVSEKEDLKIYTISELDNMMVKALEEEDYERAAYIRDEIQSRKK